MLGWAEHKDGEELRRLNQFSCVGLSSDLFVGGTAWRSTGLYLPDGSTAVITLPCTAISAGLQVTSVDLMH